MEIDIEQVNVLVVEDEEFDVRRIKNTLGPYIQIIKIVDVVSNGRDTLNYLKAHPEEVDVIILDYQISGGLYGEALIREINTIDATLPVVVITKMTVNQADLYFAGQLLKSGAYWFGTKYPADMEDYIYQPTDFILTLVNAAQKRHLETAKNRSEKKLDRNIRSILRQKEIQGQAPVMNKLRETINNYADYDASILIRGESGTGKELVAANLHYRSRRRDENFVAINCASIPNELIESELFGFERGSFTGAREEKPGLFETADGGTVFLDEIGELPLGAQAKLLRVLETGEMDKIGRKKRYIADFRLVAATNKDLEQLRGEGKFREDLYYRLNILQIFTPPLREHPEDIMLLTEKFLEYYAGDLGIIPPKMSQKAIGQLRNYDWPGNVRQLKNMVQRLLLRRQSAVDVADIRDCMDLGSKENWAAPIPMRFNKDQIIPLRQIEHEFRKKYFESVRSQFQTDAEAAEKLGLAPPNFHRMCKELGLK